MASNKKKQDQQNRYWAIGIIASILLLVLFLCLQEKDSKMLNLEVKWLVVTSVPLIIAILRSNIIQKIKGFGIELETRLQEPIGKINLATINALADLPSDEKKSIVYLDNLPEAKRIQIQRLTFREGKKGYYQTGAIHEYVRRLPSLKYFEVLNSKGNFVALIPIELFKFPDYIDMEKIDLLIKQMAEKKTTDFFPHSIITDVVSENENLVKALPLVRESDYGLLPVISDNGDFLGIVTTRLIESRIADEVIAAQESK